MIVSSKTCARYKKEHEKDYMVNKEAFRKELEGLSPPYKIGFYLYRDSNRRFDYVNALQMPLDLMVKFGWIADDDSKNVIPVILGYEVNKEKAGIEITVIKDDG